MSKLFDLFSPDSFKAQILKCDTIGVKLRNESSIHIFHEKRVNNNVCQPSSSIFSSLSFRLFSKTFQKNLRYIGVTFGKYQEHAVEPYNRPRELRKKEQELHRTQTKGGPFKLNLHHTETFDPNVFKSDRPLPPAKVSIFKVLI
jgi:hypothetical protein